MVKRVNLGVALFVAGLSFWAQGAVPALADTGAEKINATDHRFMLDAARGGMGEVALGQEAANQGGSPDVINFGQRMVKDHAQINAELKQLADKKNIALPKEEDTKDKAEEQRLKQLAQRSGFEFDRDYMAKMVKDHEQDVALFEHEAAHGKDPDLRSWAQKTLPLLQDHLKQAKSTEEDLKKKQTAKR
jgi:putative membrane protein